jgi:tetratricopeptide (TPR) repeat protein
MAMAHGALRNGALDEAERLFREVIARNPESTPALDGLILTLRSLGKEDEQIGLLRRAIELDSAESLEHATHLALLLRDRGERDEARALLVGVLETDPCQTFARLHLAELAREERDYEAQLRVLEDGRDSCKDAIEIRNAIAYALATSPSDAVRDGARALELARAVSEEVGHENPDYLDTLACARAEVGRFDEARAALLEAMDLVEGHRVPEEVREVYRRHLARVEAGEPVREP